MKKSIPKLLVLVMAALSLAVVSLATPAVAADLPVVKMIATGGRSR